MFAKATFLMKHPIIPLKALMTTWCKPHREFPTAGINSIRIVSEQYPRSLLLSMPLIREEVLQTWQSSANPHWDEGLYFEMVLIIPHTTAATPLTHDLSPFLFKSTSAKLLGKNVQCPELQCQQYADSTQLCTWRLASSQLFYCL